MEHHQSRAASLPVSGRPSQRAVVDGPQKQRVHWAAGGGDGHRGHPGPGGVEGRVGVAREMREGLNHRGWAARR